MLLGRWRREYEDGWKVTFVFNCLTQYFVIVSMKFPFFIIYPIMAYTSTKQLHSFHLATSYYNPLFLRTILLILCLFCTLTNPEIAISAQNVPQLSQEVNMLSLTTEEQKWLRDHPVIRTRIGQFPPYMICDETLPPKGISIELLNLIAEKAGFQIEYLYNVMSWSEALVNIRNHEKLDLLPTAKHTKERESFLLFSENYLRLPWVIFTRANENTIWSLEDLAGKTIAVEKGFVLQERLTKEFPQIRQQLFYDTAQSLAAVSENRVDAYIGTLTVAQYIIVQHGYNNLKVAAPTGLGVHSQAFAMRDDWPLLASILNKGLASITPEERSNINRKYFSLEVAQEMDYSRFWWALVVTILAVFFVLLWNYQLRRKVDKHTRLLQEKQNLLQQQLQFSEEIFNSVPYSIFVVDSTEGGHFRIVRVNPTHLKRIGLTAEDINGKKLEELAPLFPSDAIEQTREIWQQCVDAKETIQAEEQGRLWGKNTWWAATRTPLRDKDGRIYRIVCTGIEITDRKIAELNLQKYREELEDLVEKRTEQLRKLHRAVEQSHTTIVITDLDGTIEFVNPAFTDSTGYTKDEALGQNPSLLKSEQHDKAFYQAMWDTLAKGEVWQGELYNKRKDGTCYWEFATISPVKDNAGKTTHFVAIKEDITRRKEADKQLEEAITVANEMSHKAEAANLAKSTFLANMAHELRTPLNVILGFSRLLERGTSVTAEQLEKLELIHRSGDHLLALINNILDISKIESGRIVATPENFDLITFLDGLAMMFKQRAAEKAVQFTFKKDQDIPVFIRTDKGKLRQILFNLLGNAMDYTRHGSVVLQVATVEERDLLLRFTVRDTGIGIDPSDIDLIFKPFIQAESGTANKCGTGLGLSISQSFATLLGSSIQVTSETGTGSTFWFDLPIRVALTGEVTETPPLNLPIGLALDQPVCRILVVEDHRESRLMLAQLLRMIGFEVQEAVNGKEGVEFFLDFQPDLILMDINMPVMDGLTATGNIRDTKPGSNIPIIALTAHAFEKERKEILAAGCDDCIAKPYDEKILFAVLSNYLGVQFDYGGKEEPGEQQQVSSIKTLDLKALAELPNALLSELRVAAVELNQQRTLDCIVQIRIKDDNVADALESLAKNFMFEELVKQIDKLNG